MQLEINGVVRSHQADDEEIRRELETFPVHGDGFAILSATQMTYIQMSGNLGNPSGGLILEYQDGSLGEHYTCLNHSLDISAVIQIFILFLHSDTRWKTHLQWEKLELDDGFAGER